MNIELTVNEVKPLNFYLKQALIDARGMVAIGIGNKMHVKNLESIQKKIRNASMEK